MAECLYDYATDVEIPSRRSLSPKKYFCHSCRRNCAVIEEDLLCKACLSQFVEEITPETNLDDFRRRSSMQLPEPDHHTLFPGALAGLMDFHNRFTEDSSDHVIELSSSTRHQQEPLERRRVSGDRRANQADLSCSLGLAEERDEFQDALASRSGDDYSSDDFIEIPASAELGDDEDSEDSDIDLETVSPVLQETLGNLIRRTIRRTMADFGVPEDDTSNALRLSLEAAAASRLSGGEPAAGSDYNILPAIAELSNNTHPRSLHDLFQLASNLGDYAFVGEWDAIITQILNETDISGSPPLDSKKIEAIPKISIRKEDIYKSLQCTICLDDFRLAETAKNLPCNHVFHDDCIVPWLQLHDTCPICRKQINIE